MPAEAGIQSLNWSVKGVSNLSNRVINKEKNYPLLRVNSKPGPLGQDIYIASNIIQDISGASGYWPVRVLINTIQGFWSRNSVRSVNSACPVKSESHLTGVRD